MPARAEQIDSPAWVVRFYGPEQDPDEKPPFRGVCILSLHATEPGVAWVIGMHGDFTRRSIVDLARVCRELGIEYTAQKRAPGHTAPGGVLHEDGSWRISVADTLRRADARRTEGNA